MALKETASKTTAAVGLSGVVTMGALFALLDDRYAQASEVQMLVDAMYDERVERGEYELKELERRIRRIVRIPEEERSQWEVDELFDLTADRERLLRVIERLHNTKEGGGS